MLFKSDEKEPRFAVVRTEGKPINYNFRGEFRVIVDRETGVHYLWVRDGASGGLTPLLDKYGNPIGSQK